MNRRGVTMVELILTITAGAAIALTAIFLVEPFDNLMFTFWRRSGTDEAQAAMTRMLQEIERVKAPANITTFTGTHFAFVDIDEQAVDFQLTGTDLMRNTDILARNVQSLDFEYLDGSSVVTAVQANIRVVRVTLSVLSGDQTVRFQSSALIRNGVT